MPLAAAARLSVFITWSAAVFCAFVINHSTAAADQSGLDPPAGNYEIWRVRGKGKQIYGCRVADGNQTWTQIAAKAKLFPIAAVSSTPSTFAYKKLVGLHYFLPHPDSGAGRATWSSTAPGANGSTVPDSTVTGKVLVSIPSNDHDSIDSILREATSHTGSGNLSRVTYIQRISNEGGVAPSSRTCTRDGKLARVPYQSIYVFWAQQTSFPFQDLPPSLSPPAETKPFIAFFGEGSQNYIYNGSSWNLKDATASLLSSGPGEVVVGRHFFLPQSDANGGRPSWETFYPKSMVTAKAVRSQIVDSNSIPWVLFQMTSSSGDRNLLGSALWVYRISSRGGLPPPASSLANVGDAFESPYTSIYWFFVHNKNQVND